MSHIPYISTIFKIELVFLTFLLINLIIFAITKKDMILSDTAVGRLKDNWPKFRITFILALLAMFFFFILVIIELLEVETGNSLRSIYTIEVEIVKVAIVTTLIMVGLLNLVIVKDLIGGGK